MLTHSSPMVEQKLLRRRLDTAAIEARAPRSREPVFSIVSEILTSMDGDVSRREIKLYRELEDLARYIRRLKSEVAALGADRLLASVG